MSMMPDLRLDPYPWYTEMLRTSPVVFSPEFGCYLVFRAEDVRKVMQDANLFSSAIFDGLSTEMPFEHQLTGMDPPRHTQLRSLAAHAFTPKAVKDLEPEIVRIVNRYIDMMLERKDADFVRDFAIPFPIEVISAMLGVPDADRSRFKQWSDTIVEISERLLTGAPELPAHVAIYNEMLQYFGYLLEERQRNPQEDLISRLALAEIGGQRLSSVEAGHFCTLLMVAGNETTTNLLTNAIRTFAEYPDQWQLLRQNPKLIPQAVEEVMRYRTSVQIMYRVAKKDTVLSGVFIPAGKRVAVFLGAANRDPAKFERPDEFDITRTPGAHLTFGHGIHFCLGAPLARLEISTALKAMLGRVSSFTIPPERELEPLTGMNFLGLKRLPIRFES